MTSSSRSPVSSVLLLMMMQAHFAISFGQYAPEHDPPQPGPNAGETPFPSIDVWSGRPTSTKANVRAVPKLLKRTDGARSIAFSPDGKTLATGDTSYSALGEAKLWDLASGNELATLKEAQRDGNQGCVFARWFYARHCRGVRERDRASRGMSLGPYDEKGPAYPSGTRRPWTTFAFSPDGRTLATGERGSVWLWDTVTGQEQVRILANRRWVRSVAFSADGGLLAIGGDAGPFNLRLWEIAENRGRTRTTAPSDLVILSAAFSPHGDMFAVAGQPEQQTQCVIHIYELAQNRLLVSIPSATSKHISMAFSPDGEYFAAVGQGMVKMWKTGTWEELGLFGAEYINAFASLAISNDGRQMAVSPGSDRPVLLWNMASGAKAHDCGERTK